MNILRKIGVALCALLLLTSLMGGAWTYVAAETIFDRQTVKGWLEDGGFYDNLLDGVLENATKNGENADIPTDDPEVRAVFEKALEPETLRQNANAVLDGVYGYLDGDSPELEFTVDISSFREQLIAGLGSYAVEHAASLPACDAATQPTGEFNALDAECLPAGITPEQAGELAKNELLDQDFLKDDTLSADDIKVNQDGQEVPLNQASGLNDLKDGYEFVKSLPIILAVVAVVSAAGVILLSDKKRSGIKRASGVVLSAGLLLGISYLLVGPGFGLVAGQFDSSDKVTEQLAGDMLRTISSDISQLLLWFVVGYIVIGVIGLLAAAFAFKSKGGKDDDSSEPPAGPTPTADDSAALPAQKPPMQNKPNRRPPRKIQL